MQYTQFLIFEICKECNLGPVHGACPNMDSRRWDHVDTTRVLTDEQIVEIAVKMHEQYGFRGAIGWHYYNEPLIAKDRILSLMKQIRAKVPEARFVLWTNGHLIPEDPSDLSAFDFAWVTNYDKGDYTRILQAIPNSKEMRWELDGRIEPLGPEREGPCGRPYSEFIIDYHGEVHLCCLDWQRNVEIGNVLDQTLGEIVSKWQSIRSKISGRRMDADAPEACRRCTGRHARVSSLIPEIARAGKAHSKGKAPAPKVGPDQIDLAIACLDRSGNSVSDEWLEHHEQFAKVQVVETDKEAFQFLRDSGRYLGVVLTPDQALDGPVEEALKLHPNENQMDVDLYNVHLGIVARTISIFRIADIDRVQTGEAQVIRKLKRMQINLKELRIIDKRKPAKNGVAVTFTAYRIPEKRLAEHFEWNDKIYRESGAKVLVVTDKQYAVPDYAKCVVYPEPMPVFNLSATSNFGIRYAIDSGFQTIIKTDVDLVYSDEVWKALASPGPKAVVPLYLMAKSYKDRATDYVQAPGATGTVSMNWLNWTKAHYNADCVGYGSDDAAVCWAIESAGIEIDRADGMAFWHIAHIEGTPQKEFNKADPRVDHWGRDEGFNPENFGHNRKLRRKVYTNPQWGLAGFSEMTVVCTHYKMPEQRLRDFFEWNDELFRKNKVRVIVVSDQEWHGLPEYARVAVFPSELSMFSLSRTSNFGIRRAGSGKVCKTDPDCVFSEEAMRECFRVNDQNGVCMTYLMAESYRTKNTAVAWTASKGTICLTWDHWNAVNGYDERLQGYGCEDGWLLDAARHKCGDGRSVEVLKVAFWHIAHSENKQERGSNRRDCWNRDSGFNPKNHRGNKAARRGGKWACDSWGIFG